MKKLSLSFILAILWAVFLAGVVSAQTAQLSLRLSRDWGYGGFNGDIQGLFSMHATGPSDLARVEFFVDSNKIGESDKAPFKLQFKTDDYSVGIHALSAVGYSISSQQYASNVIRANFVSAAAGNGAAVRIVIPVLAITFGMMLLAALVPLVTGRKTKNLPAGTPRSYPLGGAICPKCGRPFEVHFWGLNLFMSKYDRCPYCGKWSVVKFASLEKLHEAEQAEQGNGNSQVGEMTGDEKLKKELDDSKYQGL
jgi:hypothetical protein